ncbi:MAG: hypothetical protein KDC54_06370 [Lewinella sp.]|nr:hypothetical protein [Lewinella sp.]
MKKRYFYGLLPALLLFCLSLQAQDRPTDRYGLPIPRFGVQFSAVHWFDPSVPGPHLSFLHRLAHERTYMRYELGYLLDLNYQQPLDIQGLWGVRGRVTRRRYRQTLSTQGSVRFWEVSFSYRYLDMDIAGDFWRDQFQYQQRLVYKLRQHNLSLSYIIGNSFWLAPRLRLDVGAGIGFRVKLPRHGAVPEDAVFDTNGYLLWQYQSSNDPVSGFSAPLLLHLGYFW